MPNGYRPGIQQYQPTDTQRDFARFELAKKKVADSIFEEIMALIPKGWGDG